MAVNLEAWWVGWLKSPKIDVLKGLLNRNVFVLITRWQGGTARRRLLALLRFTPEQQGIFRPYTVFCCNSGPGDVIINERVRELITELEIPRLGFGGGPSIQRKYVC